jgi:hypothetical protein
MKKILFGTLAVLLIFTNGCQKERGCTDPIAINYNSAADESDESCVYSDTVYIKDTLRISCHKDSISKKIHVDSPLNYSYEDRKCLGYWLDELQYARETSVWDRLFMVAVFDKKTLEPWHSQEHGDFGHLNYNKHLPGINGYNFYFKNYTQIGIENLISFVQKIPDGNYVLFYSFKGNNCQYMLNSSPVSMQYEAMYNEIGANVDSLKNYPAILPYILLFKKGDPKSVEEMFYKEGLTKGKVLCLETTIKNY